MRFPAIAGDCILFIRRKYGFRMLRQLESTPYLQKMQIRLFLCRKICTNSFSIFHGSVLPWQMLHILVVKNLVRF